MIVKRKEEFIEITLTLKQYSFKKWQTPIPAATLTLRFTDTRRFLCCYALLLPTRSKTNKEQRTFFYSDTPVIWILFMPLSVSVSKVFDFNSIEVPSSTVCDLDRYFHHLWLRKSSFQSKGGAYRLLAALHSVFFLVN